MSTPKVSLLRLQATTSCNLNCTYCYIPASVRRRTDVMSLAVLETTLRRLVDEDLLDGQLTISWHGAEPLSAGLPWYRSASTVIDQLLPDVGVTQVFQTNGVLINADWCDFFAEHDAHVGVSLDGPARTNTARVNWAGRPMHDAAVRGAAQLTDAGIPWTMLAVITDAVMEDPNGFVDFVRSTGCTQLGFKVEETNVANRSRLRDAREPEQRYAGFIGDLWRAFGEDGPVRVREFDAFRALRRAGENRQARPVTVIPLRNLTVAATGQFTIYSGELLFQDGEEFVFGNVLDGPILDCLASDRVRAVSAEILAGIRRCAAQCPFYADCGSFYVSQKHAEHGTFDATETVACRMEIKTMFTALDGIAGPSRRPLPLPLPGIPAQWTPPLGPGRDAVVARPGDVDTRPSRDRCHDVRRA